MKSLWKLELKGDNMKQKATGQNQTRAAPSKNEAPAHGALIRQAPRSPQNLLELLTSELENSLNYGRDIVIRTYLKFHYCI